MDVGVTSPRRGQIFLVDLEPTVGRGINHARPCAIVSPDELNSNLGSLLVAPMTTGASNTRSAFPAGFKIVRATSCWISSARWTDVGCFADLVV